MKEAGTGCLERQKKLIMTVFLVVGNSDFKYQLAEKSLLPLHEFY